MNAVTIPFDQSLRAKADSAGSRELGPDMVRCLACILVVLLHASVPYLVHPMPGLVWLVADTSSQLVDSIFWGIEIFVMPLFLLLSGFYGWNALAKDSSRAYLRSRGKRLLRPLAFGMILVLPIDLYLWTFGLIVQGHLPLMKLRSLKIPSPWGDHLWGLSHLWYLLYVFLYAVLLWTAYQGVLRLKRSQLPARKRAYQRLKQWCQPLHSAIAIVVVAISTLAVAPEIVYGFQHAFWPVPSKWLYSGTFFVGGALLAKMDPQWYRVQQSARLHLTLGVCGLVAAVVLGTWRLELIQRSSTGSLSLAQWSLAAITVFAAWTMTLGIVGAANRIGDWLQTSSSLWSQRACRQIQFFAAASFWIYLIHHPIVGLIQLDLYWLQTPVHPLAKSVFATVLACTLGAITYRWWFHETRAGVWLGLSAPGLSASGCRPSVATLAIPVNHEQAAEPITLKRVA